MIDTVFVDMDGVLADFNGRVYELFGTTSEEATIPGVFNTLEKLGVSDGDMWTKINEDEGFWEKLKPYPWVPELLKGLEKIFGSTNIAIMTSPGDNGPTATAKALGGKIRWIYAHVPAYAPRTFFGKSKQMCACRHKLLIDDSDRKIVRFNKAGGKTIIFPQRWNSAFMQANEFRVDKVLSTADRLWRYAEG